MRRLPIELGHTMSPVIARTKGASASALPSCSGSLTVLAGAVMTVPPAVLARADEVIE